MGQVQYGQSPIFDLTVHFCCVQFSKISPIADMLVGDQRSIYNTVQIPTPNTLGLNLVVNTAVQLC